MNRKDYIKAYVSKNRAYLNKQRIKWAKTYAPFQKWLSQYKPLWYKMHKKSFCTDRRANDINLWLKRYYFHRNREKYNIKSKEYNQKIRSTVLQHYGGSIPKCSCCGEPRTEFLCLDHIDNTGGQHRKSLKGSSIYLWIIKHKFPTGFRVLCHNCNCARGFYGYCPHEKE